SDTHYYGCEHFLPLFQTIITPYKGISPNTFARCNYFINVYKPIQMSKRFTKKRNYSFVIALLVCWMDMAYSQSQLTVTGKIVFQDGAPAVGVSVAVKGTTTATASDDDGNYRISVPSTGTLVFTQLGAVPQEIAVDSRTTVNVTLESDVSALDEVVVVGFG